MGIFSNLTGRTTVESKSLWTDDERNIDRLAIAVYQDTKSATAKEISGWGKSGKESRTRTCLVLSFALLHLVDRYLKATNASDENRKNIMSFMCEGFLAEVIRDKSGLLTTDNQKSRMYDEIFDLMSAAVQSYDKCRFDAYNQNESQAGNLFWEIGKNFADAAKHPKDAEWVVHGGALTARLVSSVGIFEFIESMKKR